MRAVFSLSTFLHTSTRNENWTVLAWPAYVFFREMCVVGLVNVVGAYNYTGNNFRAGVS